MLSPYRVIDLSNERGLLCGQILADLGADVIQVEPPGGNSARLCGPWYQGVRGDENSLFSISANSLNTISNPLVLVPMRKYLPPEIPAISSKTISFNRVVMI